MDFRGQFLASIYFRIIIVTFATIGFFVGWTVGNIGVALLIHTFGIFVSIVACVPSWPYYSRMGIKWQPVKRRHSNNLSVVERVMKVLHLRK